MNNTMNDNIIKLLIGVFSAVITIISTWVVRKLTNRISYFRKEINHQVVGKSTNSDTWGDIKITWNNSVLNNLYFFTAKLVNDTNKDAPKNMIITLSFEQGCTILQQDGVIYLKDVQRQILLDASFFQKFNEVQNLYLPLDDEIANKDKNLMKDVDFVTRHRIFNLPVFNRGNIAMFNFLVVTTNHDSEGPIQPTLSVGITEPGFDIILNETFKKKKSLELINKVIVSAIYIAIAFPIMHYAPNSVWAVWLMFANSFISFGLGWCLSLFLRYVRLM